MGNRIASRVLDCDCDDSGCRINKVRELRLGDLHPSTPEPPYLGSSSNSSPYHLTTVTASKTIDDSFEMDFLDISQDEKSLNYRSPIATKRRFSRGRGDEDEDNDDDYGGKNESPVPDMTISPTSVNEETIESSCMDESCNTLPSFKMGEPIHLRLAEQGYSLTDNFSFDPYLRCGQFMIQRVNENGRLLSYGNGLVMKVGAQFMTLEDKHGKVYAACKSRYTYVPSYIIYGPRPRYFGQAKSTHKFVRTSMAPGLDSVQLYPWALVKKHGRNLESVVSIHMVNPESSHCSFKSEATFQSVHQFTAGVNTHTIVSRIERIEDKSVSSSTNQCSRKEIYVPCGLSIKEPFNNIDIEVSDCTVAPGIDPLLMVCYFAIHSKMDVEPQPDPI